MKGIHSDERSKDVNTISGKQRNNHSGVDRVINLLEGFDGAYYGADQHVDGKRGQEIYSCSVFPHGAVQGCVRCCCGQLLSIATYPCGLFPMLNKKQATTIPRYPYCMITFRYFILGMPKEGSSSDAVKMTWKSIVNTRSQVRNNTRWTVHTKKM